MSADFNHCGLKVSECLKFSTDFTNEVWKRELERYISCFKIGSPSPKITKRNPIQKKYETNFSTEQVLAPMEQLSFENVNVLKRKNVRLIQFVYIINSPYWYPYILLSTSWDNLLKHPDISFC